MKYFKILALTISASQALKVEHMAQIDEAIALNTSNVTGDDKKLAQTSSESQFRFDINTGDVIRTSFLSLDLLTLAQVLGISQGKTWGQVMMHGEKSGMPGGVDDKNIWSFLKSLTKQNEKILANM